MDLIKKHIQNPNEKNTIQLNVASKVVVVKNTKSTIKIL